MTLGIGGAGSRLAVKLDPGATIVNVSQIELEKTPAEHRILAMVHAARGQLQGSRKDPAIGRAAFASVKDELLALCRNSLLFASTGGGTGSGMTAALLEELATRDDIPPTEKAVFALLLPHAERESAEYVNNTLDFLRGPLSLAIDTGNTGNIFLFSNRLKFESRLPEDEYNTMLVDSLQVFLAIPEKCAQLDLLDGHIDPEDFSLFMSRPYFNHFTYFEFDPAKPFGEQLRSNLNPLLLLPDNPIEALFLLEVPADADPAPFYDLIDFFVDQEVTPSYTVVRNSQRGKYFVTVSLLYSRKPAELVEDFSRISEKRARAKVRKSLEQHVTLPRLEVNLERETKRVGKEKGATEEDVLAVLQRIGKL
ncbi:MAG: hypothetical protein GXP31_05550 [Kiritimatiellaeota bacterium]|nr:hypothetical protein [Kiritimatiellota bacterium]